MNTLTRSASETGTRRFAGLAADEHGSDDGRPPVVLLHGLTFDRSMWRPALDELAGLDPGRRVLALDLPGHGESASRPSYGMDEVVDHVHAAVAEAGVREPVLVGHSISAVISTIYATRHPAAGVVNVDQSLLAQPYAEFVQSIAAELEGDRFDEIWRQTFWRSMNPQLLPLPAEALLRRTSRPRQELVLGYWRDALDRPPAELAAWSLAGLATLRERGTPYLVVAGDELDAGYRAWLARQLPQAKVTVLPGSGHFPHLAHPRRFAELLAAFAQPRTS